jgi:hypothetical protein
MTIFRVGIENNNEGIRSMAWVLEYPGCYAYGKDEQEAQANLPAAIRAYSDWLAAHGDSSLDTKEIKLKVEDVWPAYCIDDSFERMENGDPEVDNEIGAWFQYDWKPLTAEEVQRGLQLLTWTRADLLATIQPLTDQQWANKAEGEGERWDIKGIVRHVADADRWYVDRLGLAYARDESPTELMPRLEKSRALIRATLPALEGAHKVVGIDGEIWSPRKMLRRSVWHERDHTEHIRKLI